MSLGPAPDTHAPRANAPSRALVTRFLQLVAIPEPPRDLVPLTEDELGMLLPLARYERVMSWVASRTRVATLDRASDGVHETLRKESVAHTAYLLRVAATLEAVQQIIRGLGCRSVPLKGAAYGRMTDRYPFFRHRSTSDLDLLVEPGASQAAWDALRAAGFDVAVEGPGVHPDLHHHPGLRGPFGIGIEIHKAASLHLSASESWSRLAHGGQDGPDGLHLPSVTELFWHQCLHSMGDGAKGCRLRDLLSAAALIAGPEPVDWELIAYRTRNDRIRNNDSRHPVPRGGVNRWLATAFALSGSPVPAPLDLPTDVVPRLVTLLQYRVWVLRNTSAPPSPPDERLGLRLDEAARSAFGLGIGRLPHWLPWWLRPKRMAGSVLMRVRYLGFAMLPR